jgi:hypothetical protein
MQEPTNPSSIPDAPLDDEHVHVGNEVDKLLVQGRKDEGVRGVLKVNNHVIPMKRYFISVQLHGTPQSMRMLMQLT